MKTEVLLEIFKAQFETKFDAWQLSKINPDEFNTCFTFEDDKILKGFGRRRQNQFDFDTTDKQDVYRYLTSKFLKDQNLIRKSTTYGTADFYELFWSYWLSKFEIFSNTLSLVSKFYAEENISSNDQIYPSVQWEIYSTLKVRIHIINQKYITEILFSLDSNIPGLVKFIHRVQHEIQREIKRIEAVSDSLNVYFHGVHNPFIIPFDTYKEVIELQLHLLELRNQSPYHNRKYK